MVGTRSHMAITSHDVAKLAGVSQPTVSRALRGDPRVSPHTRDKVLQAAAALGYVPSEAGRSLVTRVTKRVGIVVSDLTNPFYPHLIGPLHDALSRHDYRMMVITERSDAEVPAERLADGSADGYVLLTSNRGSLLPAELDRRGMPYVFLNRETDVGMADAAVVDNRDGGRIAAEHLLRTGHTRIAGIFGPEDTSTGRDRETGFRLALAKAGVALPSNRIRWGGFDFDTGYRETLALLDTAPRPTAIFCGNDVVAIGALNAARASAVTVPDELSVVGFDDIPMAAWETFRLKTIGHDLEGMATAAAQLLVARLAAPECRRRDPRRVVMAPRLVSRGTVAAPAKTSNTTGG